MKITMLTIGSTGDVVPYILLGKELQSRGHAITISGFSRFRELVENAGLHFYALSGSADRLMSCIMQPGSSGWLYLPHVEKGLKAVAPQLLHDMSESCSDADAMVCGFFGSVYYSIAEKYNIPCVQTHYFPMDPTRKLPIPVVKNQKMAPWMNSASYRLGYLFMSIVEKRYLSSWRRENHLQERKLVTVPDCRVGDHRIPVIYAISPLVLPRPTEWDSRIYMSGYWFDSETSDWVPPESLQDFLENGETPVYIGFGSMNSGNMNRLMALTLRAVHAAGLRAVINLGWSGTKLKSTRNVYFADYIPHNWLFPRVRAVIHHGGAGTTAAGLRFGKPALVIPFSGDQYFWGHRVYSLGCGPKPVPRDSLSVQRLTKSLLDLTGKPRYSENARALGEKLRAEDGTRVAADLIEKEIAAW